MGILQECLNVCGYHVNYTESNKELAGNIFRSVEVVGAGFMGPYRVGYAVRIAYEFADDAHASVALIYSRQLPEKLRRDEPGNI